MAVLEMYLMFITKVFCHKRLNILHQTINSSSHPTRLSPEIIPECVQVYMHAYNLHIYVSLHGVFSTTHFTQQ